MRCVAQLVDSNQANIRSGWKNVFGVLGIAASSEREAIVEVSDFFSFFFINYRLRVVSFSTMAVKTTFLS